jgi:hypothetical protein
MASGWSQYAVMVRRCNNQIWGAGLFGHDGTMWGQDGLPLKTTEDVQRTKQEVAKLCQLVSTDETADQRDSSIFQDGFKFLDRDWAAVRMDSGMIVGKGKAPNTAQFCGRKTAKCFVIALAHAEGSNTNAISGASQIGDFLDESGY